MKVAYYEQIEQDQMRSEIILAAEKWRHKSGTTAASPEIPHALSALESKGG